MGIVRILAQVGCFANKADAVDRLIEEAVFESDDSTKEIFKLIKEASV